MKTIESYQPGKLVSLHGRDWVVLPSNDPNLLRLKPLGGTEREEAGVYLPLEIERDEVRDAKFNEPTPEDIGDFSTAKLLFDASRLSFRNGAGPFRALAKLSFRPRAFQLVPLIMALRQDTVRLLIADDVGVGKTIEALLIARELLERQRIKSFAVVCLPHLCEQWQEEIRNKLDLEAVIIKPSTKARLDREVQGDKSVFQYYPYQIISIDFIKGVNYCDRFCYDCPDLIIVDEAHTCARPAGTSTNQQQRYALLSKLAREEKNNLILLTATPHSGKQEEFQSLLGLLNPKFENIEVAKSSEQERKQLAKHFVQRRRGDVKAHYCNEDTPFPERKTFEQSYNSNSEYQALYNEILQFSKEFLVSEENSQQRYKKARYWTALALLRAVSSSPAAALKMLGNKLEKIELEDTSEDGSSQSYDDELELSLDPTTDPEEQTLADTDARTLCSWSDRQKQKIRKFSDKLLTLKGFEKDAKLKTLAEIIEEWLKDKFNPVVFCRYIATANYVGEELKKQYPNMLIEVVTSEIPDELRKERIQSMESAKQRILIATDCLSEGINLQELFTAVVHYDLPWNPNRLEQREGRVDRFGQMAPVVKSCLLYGSDNIDGIVLDVLLRKVVEIRKNTGVSVPFPEDSKSVLDAIATALLESKTLEPEPTQEQLSLLPESAKSVAEQKKSEVTQLLDKAVNREKQSRTIFAQNAIKAEEIEVDLKSVDEAIGNPKDVEKFVVNSLTEIFGVQIDPTSKEGCYTLFTANLPDQLKYFFQQKNSVKVSFISPTPEGYLYLGRNNKFVEQLCQLVMSNTLNRRDKRAYRASVIRTSAVEEKTTILLFRCRNVIEQQKRDNNIRIVAEEMLLWGWRGVLSAQNYLTHLEAKELLENAKSSANLSHQSRVSNLEAELALLGNLDDKFSKIAEKQSEELVQAHQRFSNVVENNPKFQVVYPVLPMDILGVYVLLPFRG